MIVFPNAKINLGLFITGKRNDGFHNLVSCFYPIPWYDILEIAENKKFSFESTGISIPGKPDDNLCLKAYKLLNKDFQLPRVSIYLYKNIPIGAGLGGGSADGSFMLRACNELFNLYLEDVILENYAGELGSDCPFFIKNKPVIVTGKGDIMDDIDISLAGKYIALVNPNIHISTAEAYRGINKYSKEVDLKKILSAVSPYDWKNYISNDFEASILETYPAIRSAKEKMYKAGAFYASMTGSGATVYGLFDQEVDLKDQFPVEYSVLQAKL